MILIHFFVKVQNATENLYEHSLRIEHLSINVEEYIYCVSVVSFSNEPHLVLLSQIWREDWKLNW